MAEKERGSKMTEKCPDSKESAVGLSAHLPDLPTPSSQGICSSLEPPKPKPKMKQLAESQ